MRTQWTIKGNRDAGSSCLCDRGLHRYLRNFGGGLNTPNHPLGTPLVQTTNSNLCIWYLKIVVCWNVTPYNLVQTYWRFRKISFLHLERPCCCPEDGTAGSSTKLNGVTTQNTTIFCYVTPCSLGDSTNGPQRHNAFIFSGHSWSARNICGCVPHYTDTNIGHSSNIKDRRQENLKCQINFVFWGYLFKKKTHTGR